MKNITFDTTNFSEQLGLYDFFNVLLAGTIFVCGCSIICSDVNSWLWTNMTFQKGLLIILAIYIIGMILQEFGSFIDRHFTNIYKGMSQSVLKENVTRKFGNKNECIICNSKILEKYRDSASKFLGENITDDFEDDLVNGYIFSHYQYLVSIKGMDKKSEKLRALFGMAKTLMACFFSLAILSFSSVPFKFETSLNICEKLGLSNLFYENCTNKYTLMILFSILTIIFYFRAKRTMKNFLLILFGTCEAIITSELPSKKLRKKRRVYIIK